MNWSILIISGLLGLATAVGVIVLTLQSCRHNRFLSRQIELHHTNKISVPRLGGIALAASMVVVLSVFTVMSGPAFLQDSYRWQVAVTSLAMFGLGLWDDLFVLGARRKLLGQLLIATAAYSLGIGIYHFKIPLLDRVIELGLWSWPVTVFWLVAITNLINLIDGVDGLAGGICLMLTALLIYVSIGGGLVPVIGTAMVGGLIGFLWFNFPPAKIYMGDGGAYFLGFLIGCSTIISSQKGTIFAALIAPLFVLALPILDTSLAILRRGLRGLPLFRPDRKHIHHRLLASGHSRRNVVLGLYCFTAFFLLLGFTTLWLHGQYLPLLLGVSVLTVLGVAGRLNFSREWFAIGRVLGNSLEARAEVQYSICLTRWLAMEGSRCEGVEELCEDILFIARKLGFVSVQIRLEDDEKSWLLVAVNDCGYYQHDLPGQKYCFLKLGFPRGGSKDSSTPSEATFNILGDLLSEGWSKAIQAWKDRGQVPRFDARLKPVSPALLGAEPDVTAMQSLKDAA